MEKNSRCSSPRMADRCKATGRAYNERKPTKTPKKKQKRSSVNNPKLSSVTENLTLRGDWCLTFASIRQGRSWLCSQAGRAWGRSGILSPPLLRLPVFSPPLLEALPSFPTQPLSGSKGAAGLARTQQAVRLGLQLQNCGKNLNKLHHTVSSVATWFRFKRQRSE